VLPSYFSLPVSPVWQASIKESREAYDKILTLRDEAAEKMKKQFDKDLIEVKFSVGQKIWLRNEEVTATHPEERIGPFEVVRLIGAVNIEIKSIENGPTLGTRHKIQSIRNAIHFVGPDPGPQQEWKVSDVLDHRGGGRGRKYRVLWDDGDTTWEPIGTLADFGEEGEVVLNAALSKYFDRNPQLTRPKPKKPGKEK